MSIYKKLLAVQKEVGAISKDSKNPFFKSKYFDINKLIEHVQPLLSREGIVLTQPIIDGAVCTMLTDTESEGNVNACLSLPANMTDPQKIGATITYYRRYTLSSLLGLQAEDDDGNTSSGKTCSGNTCSGKACSGKAKETKPKEATKPAAQTKPKEQPKTDKPKPKDFEALKAAVKNLEDKKITLEWAKSKYTLTDEQINQLTS